MDKKYLSWVGTIISNGSGVIMMGMAVDVASLIVMIIGIVSGLFTITYNVWSWYREVTKENSDEGKNITKDELFDGVDKVMDKLKEKQDGYKNRK